MGPRLRGDDSEESLLHIFLASYGGVNGECGTQVALYAGKNSANGSSIVRRSTLR